ncbi:MAG: S8 family peptidase [Methylococcaceae bacterium]|jgi:subtilisin family serine protease
MAEKRSKRQSSRGGSKSGDETPRQGEPFELGIDNSDEAIGSRFARLTAPRELDNPIKRKKWGLPPMDQPDALGDYIVELNVQHMGGLPGAAHAFDQLYMKVVKPGPKRGKISLGTEQPPARCKPLRIAKSYYRCKFKDAEWRKLVALDEAKPLSEQAIYRLWPDFPISARTDRSVVTVKADAAMRSFDAAGEDITWAVIDSGIDATHLHFGVQDTEEDKKKHVLWADSVRDLHRCFADVERLVDGVPLAKQQLESPDWDPGMNPEEYRKMLDEHREWALRDEFGHGTHVSGIIAGAAPEDKSKIVALEHQYRINEDGTKISQCFRGRPIPGNSQLRGVAPRCRLVSLRVLDEEGKGRASQVIQALEYIRDKINDNPKLMRVHGVNLSVGYEFDAEMFACGQSPLCTSVDRLVQEGVVVVSAAGNTGYGTLGAQVGSTKVGLSNTINDPGNAAFAITVGSTHRDSPHTYGVSYFSSKGPTGDGRLKPDLVAPGERITSCAAGIKLKDARKSSDVPLDAGNAYYMDDSGTSMAAPHVSGAIAAFLSIRREFIGKPLEVKRIFLESATPLGRERYFEGHGLVDLMRAIQSV